MKYRIVCVTYANEREEFFVQKRSLLRWNYFYSGWDGDEIRSYRSFDEAKAFIHYVIGSELNRKVVKTTVVFETKV